MDLNDSTTAAQSGRENGCGRPLLERRWKGATWVWLLIILGVNTLAYAPAFTRFFVADQLMYFAELDGSDSLVDGLRLYDYNATRQYNKGDEILYRPLLFVGLAIQRTLFSYHYVAWNVTTWTLHLLVVALLYRLLLITQPNGFAGLFALLFSIFCPSVEMVVWHHINGYLVAMAFFLAAWIEVEERGRSGFRPWRFALFTTLSVFEYELLLPFSWLLAFQAFRTAGMERDRSPRFLAFVLALPTLVYGLAYLDHLRRVQRIGYVASVGGGGMFSSSHFLDAFSFWLETLVRWTGEILFPLQIAWKMEPFGRLIMGSKPWVVSPELVSSALLAVGLCIVLGLSISADAIRRKGPTLFTSGAMMVGYPLLLCIGRGQVQISYFLYFFELAGMVMLYNMLDWERLAGRRRLMFVVLVMIFAMVHLLGTWELTRRIHRVHKESHIYFRAIDVRLSEARRKGELHPGILKPDGVLGHMCASPIGYEDSGPERLKMIPLGRLIYGRWYDDEKVTSPSNVRQKAPVDGK